MGCESSILVNGGFENWTEGVPDGWGAGGTQEAVIVHGGDSSLSISDNEVTTSDTPLLSNGCYTFDFWYNCDVVEQGAYWYIAKLCGEDFFYLDIDGVWNVIVNDPYQYLPATEGWENIVVGFTADGDCTYFVGVGIRNQGNTAYFDDVCLYPCEAPAGEFTSYASCGGTYLSKEDIYRLITRVDGSDYYITLVDSGVGIEETEPLECWETMTEEDILNLILVTDGTNYGLNTIILTAGDDALSATCGESLFKIDILRQRIRTDGTNYYLVVK